MIGSVRPVLDRLVILVTDRTACHKRSLEEVVTAAIQGGVNAVLLREKDLPGAELLALARRLRGLCSESVLFLVSDRVDVALLSGADGVHLPEDSLPVAAVRHLLPPSMKVGRSVHSINAARQAEADGADYLILGTIYTTASHPTGVAAGPELIEQVVARVGIPVVAIGGITPENVAECRRAGARGVAAISVFLQGDPAVARQLAEELAARPWEGTAA